MRQYKLENELDPRPPRRRRSPKDREARGETNN